MLRLTSQVSELFLQQPASEQRRLLQAIVEKAGWRHGEMQTTLFEPGKLEKRKGNWRISDRLEGLAPRKTQFQPVSP